MAEQERIKVADIMPRKVSVAYVDDWLDAQPDPADKDAATPPRDNRVFLLTGYTVPRGFVEHCTGLSNEQVRSLSFDDLELLVQRCRQVNGPFFSALERHGARMASMMANNLGALAMAMLESSRQARH